MVPRRWMCSLALMAALPCAPSAAQEVPREQIAQHIGADGAEPSADAHPALRISAHVTGADGVGIDVAQVEGRPEDMHALLLELAGLLASDSPEHGSVSSVDAPALFALGQMLEARGYTNLAADAYQALMKHHPEFQGAEDAWLRLLGRWELNLYGGLLNDEPEYAHDTSTDEFRRDAVLGVRGSYHVTRKAFVQLEVANSLIALSTAGSRQNVNAFPVWASAGWDFPVSHDFQVFPTLGAGAVVWSPDRTSGSTDFALTYGLGGRLFLTRNHALRTDVRLHHIPNAFSPTLRDLAVPTGQTLWALELTFGVSWFPAGG